MGDDPDRFLTGIFANLICCAALRDCSQFQVAASKKTTSLPSTAFSVFIALVAQITTIIFVMLLTKSSSFDILAWTNCVSTPSSCHHTAFLFLLAEPPGSNAGRSGRSSEVVG